MLIRLYWNNIRTPIIFKLNFYNRNKPNSMRFQFFIALFFCSMMITGCQDSVDTVKSVENKEEVSKVEKAETVVTSNIISETETAEVEEAKVSVKKEDIKPKTGVVIETVDVKTKAKPASSKRPKLSFKNKTFDYGMIAQGDKVSHEFKFTNTGDGDLIIKDAEASCGCTTPAYPFIPIGPGETGTISVTFNSTGKMGSHRPSIKVTSNAYPRVQTLYLDGYVADQIAKKDDLVEDNSTMNPEENTTKGGDVVIKKEDQ